MWAKELSADSIESFLVLEYDMDPDRSAGKLSKLIFEQTYEHEKEQVYTKTVDWSSYYPKTMLQL